MACPIPGPASGPARIRRFAYDSGRFGSRALVALNWFSATCALIESPPFAICSATTTPLGAVGRLHRADEHGVRDGRGGVEPFPGQKLLHIVGDLVGGRALLVPDVRQVAGEHHRCGVEARLVAAEDGDRPARRRA